MCDGVQTARTSIFTIYRQYDVDALTRLLQFGPAYQFNRDMFMNEV